MGWGQFLGKLSTLIPSRVEQMKNEKARLINERTELLANNSSAAGGYRIIAIGKRVSEINSILGNKAQD